MRLLLRLSLILIALVATHGWAADDLASSQLVDEARRWQDKGRDDLAADVWRRLLVIQPRHGEAMVSLGLIELRAGNHVQALKLYERASQLQKAPQRLNALSNALNKLERPSQPALDIAAPSLLDADKVIFQSKSAKPAAQDQPGSTAVIDRRTGMAAESSTKALGKKSSSHRDASVKSERVAPKPQKVVRESERVMQGEGNRPAPPTETPVATANRTATLPSPKPELSVVPGADKPRPTKPLPLWSPLAN